MQLLPASRYELPDVRAAKAILNGWSIDSFLYARSAPPVNISSAEVFSQRARNSRLGRTLFPVCPLEIHGSQFAGGKIFNRAAFVTAPAGSQGNLGRNVLRGFGTWQVDLSLQRQFHLSERFALRFRAEFFNLFNHPNFGPPTNVLTSALFGRSTQTLANSLGSGGANGGLNPLYQLGGPRSIQFALKLQLLIGLAREAGVILSPRSGRKHKAWAQPQDQRKKTRASPRSGRQR